MMRAFSRVFFGLQPDEVSTDTLIGYLSMELAGQRYPRPDLAVFEQLNGRIDHPRTRGERRPRPSRRGDSSLRRRRRGGRTEFKITVAAGTDAADWRQRSEDVDGLFVMRGGREFGVF